MTFRKGETGNPFGRPKGDRPKLAAKFLNLVYNDFNKHGKAAIERLREKHPREYIQIVADLLPKQVEGEFKIEHGLAQVLAHVNSVQASQPRISRDAPVTIDAPVPALDGDDHAVAVESDSLRDGGFRGET